MSIAFPNRSRSYDAPHQRIRFVGHDGMKQIAFFLEADALARISGAAPKDETDALAVFDKYVDRILNAATQAYRGTRHTAYFLGSSDM